MGKVNFTCKSCFATVAYLLLQVGFKAPKKTAKKVVQKAGNVKVPAKKASLAKKSAIKKPVPKKTGAKPKSVGNRAFSCQFFP